MISYSLYLTHVPVGGKVINLGIRYVGSDLSKYALIVMALAVSIGFAYLFNRFVELPAFRLSKRFRYAALSDGEQDKREPLIAKAVHPIA